jgi:hypothetical protein
MLSEGLDVAVVADFVRGRRVVPALTADDLLEWKRNGVPDDILRAAIPPRTQ